jgi:hypothetical protein
LRSERRVAELIEENEDLRRKTDDIVGELKSSLATIEREMEADRQSRGREIENVTAALKAKASEEVANLRSELGAMREATMTFIDSATAELMKSTAAALEQQQRETDDLRTKLQAKLGETAAAGEARELAISARIDEVHEEVRNAARETEMTVVRLEESEMRRVTGERGLLEQLEGLTQRLEAEGRRVNEYFMPQCGDSDGLLLSASMMSDNFIPMPLRLPRSPVVGPENPDGGHNPTTCAAVPPTRRNSS